MMKKEYYVYCYYDENRIPFYIGMGHGDRVFAHLNKRKLKDKEHLFFYNKLNKIIESEEDFYYEIIRENLTKEEAWLAEQVLIKCIGRRDLELGPLCNLTDGGDGRCGCIGHNRAKTAIYDCSTLRLIKTFDKAEDCSNYIGVSSGAITNAVNRHVRTGKATRCFVMYYDKEPLQKYPYTEVLNKGNGLATKVIARNINTGEEFEFNSYSKCAKYLGVCDKLIKNRINLNRGPVKNGKVMEWRFFHG